MNNESINLSLYPHSIVRKRVSISKKKKGKFVIGTVTKYDNWLKLWTVQLETGEFNEYDLEKEVFEILPEVDDIDKRSNYTIGMGNTTVNFHVIFDPRSLRSGDRVMITGSLPILTEWGPGIEMRPDPENGNVWTGSVELPFGITDYNAFGLFEYKYVIESALEGFK